MSGILQPTFAAGELSPSASARTDIARYYTGLKLCRNFMVMPYGGVRNRAGTRLVAEVKDSTKLCRLVPFQFNDVQTYILAFGDLNMRVIKDGGQVLYSAGPSIGTPFELAMPYTQYDLASLNYTQSADVGYQGRWPGAVQRRPQHRYALRTGHAVHAI
ncbi:tail tubular B [Pseudomonas phage UFJF_PfDIW6]|uniref:Tail tubular B n=1 Tax=Pseudomonas phage UFJF_PfDIW6 TaxID=2927622 RepID=A0AAE9GAJ4_9CAUD|nr:tail tubular B [Pseudomonas phage UFJF_PfDIW6]UNY42219.1 tail tubular B [Pseudomonas phage UFJF_PfDIW6]